MNEHEQTAIRFLSMVLLTMMIGLLAKSYQPYANREYALAWANEIMMNASQGYVCARIEDVEGCNPILPKEICRIRVGMFPLNRTNLSVLMNSSPAFSTYQKP